MTKIRSGKPSLISPLSKILLYLKTHSHIRIIRCHFHYKIYQPRATCFFCKTKGVRGGLIFVKINVLFIERFPIIAHSSSSHFSDDIFVSQWLFMFFSVIACVMFKTLLWYDGANVSYLVWSQYVLRSGFINVLVLTQKMLFKIKRFKRECLENNIFHSSIMLHQVATLNKHSLDNQSVKCCESCDGLLINLQSLLQGKLLARWSKLTNH